MYGNKSLVYRVIWALRRGLRMSPMQRLFRELKRRGVPLGQMDALELFGADGLRHTLDYCHSVHSLEIWEMDDKYLPGLRKNFPKARIKITDSFKELESTPNTYDLLVSDEPGQVFGKNQEYCEHFELLTEYLFRVIRSSALIILNAVPDPLRQSPNANRYPYYPGYLEKRRMFYGSDHPENISIAEMIPAYRRVLSINGFSLDWHVNVRRTIRGGVHYLALKVSRI